MGLHALMYWLLAVAVAVEADGLARLDVLADDLEDGGYFRLTLLDEGVHLVLEVHELFGHGGVEGNHRAGAVGLGTHGAELEAVAREGER